MADEALARTGVVGHDSASFFEEKLDENNGSDYDAPEHSRV